MLISQPPSQCLVQPFPLCTPKHRRRFFAHIDETPSDWTRYDWMNLD